MVTLDVHHLAQNSASWSRLPRVTFNSAAEYLQGRRLQILLVTCSRFQQLSQYSFSLNLKRIAHVLICAHCLLSPYCVPLSTQLSKGTVTSLLLML